MFSVFRLYFYILVIIISVTSLNVDYIKFEKCDNKANYSVVLLKDPYFNFTGKSVRLEVDVYISPAVDDPFDVRHSIFLIHSNNYQRFFLLQFTLGMNRCSADFKTCKKFGQSTFKKMCSKLKNPTKDVAIYLQDIQPRPICPLLGLYKINMTMNAGISSGFGLQGYSWLLEFYMAAGQYKSRKTIFCLKEQMTIS